LYADWEHGTIHLRFHGLFTYYEITKYLKAYVNNKNNSHKNFYEAKGRLAFHLRRFKLGIDSFEILGIFLPEGANWFELFKKYYHHLESEYGEMLNNVDLTDKPYGFNS
jgi:hypothetical protein